MVIAIISLLVSILVPSLTKARDLAKEVVCQTQLKQVGYAFHMYANDHNGILTTNGIQRNKNPYWMGQLSDYLGISYYPTEYEGREILKCPAYPETPKWQTYCMSGWLTMAGKNCINQIEWFPHPSETILLFDSSDGNVAANPQYSHIRIHFLHGDPSRTGEGKANTLMVAGEVTTFDSDSDVAASPWVIPSWMPKPI
ncbi:MAG: hypothetical protein JXA11_10190 [Phycisphaerae bacterium]|nr:hypothetical protein [Phycisphaerae bacterium]